MLGLAALNSTLVNETVVQSQTIVQVSYQRFVDIIQAPLNFPDMFWILAPQLATLILMEFYFSRYSKEKLGWSSAFGNSLVLIFVSVDLVRFMVNNALIYDFTHRHVVIAVVILEGALLMFVDFYHLLPKELAWGVSSKLPINFIAAAAIILVYSDIPFDLITLGGFFFLLLALTGIMILIRILQPAASGEESEGDKDD